MKFAVTLFLTIFTFLASVSSIALAQEEETDFDDPCRTDSGALFKPLGEIRSVLSDDGLQLPPDCSGSRFNSTLGGADERFASDTDFHWQPTDFFHMPVYLDDVPLERYGQSKSPHFQPVISGVKLGLQLPVLPYKMGVDRPHECISTLGHRPPGSCVPCIRQRLPKSAKGALMQAGAVVGAGAAFP